MVPLRLTHEPQRLFGGWSIPGDAHLLGEIVLGQAKGEAMSRRFQLSLLSSAGSVLFLFGLANCSPSSGSTTFGPGGATGGSSSPAQTFIPSATGGSVVAQGGTRPLTTSPVVGTGGANGGTTAVVATAPKGGNVGVTTTTPIAATGGTPVVTTTAVTATGGTPVTTTAAASVNTGKTVTFATGKGVGAMTGYGFVSLGSGDTVSSPTCGAAKAAITSAAPCAASPNWSSATALCVSGAIPALPAAPTATDYAANWGVSVGLNVTDPATAGLGAVAFTSIAATLTGTPITGLRMTLHRKGDPDSTSYCSAVTSGTAVPFTSFATDCYNTVPVGKLTAADIPLIDKVSIQVSSTSTAAITVTDLCITGITFS